MAQEVGYFETDITFKEGPFVVCNPMNNGWRIEAQMDGRNESVLPDSSIYNIEKKFGLIGRPINKEPVAEVCDILNQMVRGGLIVKKDGVWICPN